MGKKGLAGEVVMDVSLVVLFNFVWFDVEIGTIFTETFSAYNAFIQGSIVGALFRVGCVICVESRIEKCLCQSF